MRLAQFATLVAVAAAGAVTGQAFALPHSNGLAPATATFDLSRPDVDFSAIVALDDCSGSLVRFTSSSADDKALVLTNGHCYEGGFLDDGQVLVNKQSSRSFKLLSSDASSSLGTLRAEAIVYATMTGTDVTLYRLGQTYAQIKSKYGVDPLTIADRHPESGTSIDVVSGFWKKIYACSIDGFVYHLKEGGWVFTDSIRYTEPGCEVIGGTSGSPIIDTSTHQIVGINNTINENGERCTEDNPCEVDANGTVTVRKGIGYGQETYLFYGCLGEGNALDLNQSGCQLAKPASAQ